MAPAQSHKLRLVTAVLVGMTFFASVLLAPKASAAYDAGVEGVTLANTAPGATSFPFTILIGQTTLTPQASRVRVAVEGFSFDPAKSSGVQIGSADYYTDQGNPLGNPIVSNGDSGEGLTWTLDVPLGTPITAQVEPGKGLNQAGNPVAASNTTLISFDLPASLPLGAKLQKIGLRFNENWKPEPTPGVGAVNPGKAGSYLVRTWVESQAPQSLTSVKSRQITVGKPAKPKTKLKVSANRKKIKAGKKVKFTLSTTNRTNDTVQVWLLGRVIRKIKVGPKARSFSWKAPRKLARKKAAFAFVPKGGATKRLSVKVTR